MTCWSDAETKLVHDAEDERSQQRWYVHAGNLAFNTGVLLFLGLGYHRWRAISSMDWRDVPSAARR